MMIESTQLRELLQKKEQLDQEIQALRTNERGNAIAKIREMMNDFSIAPGEILKGGYLPRGRGKPPKINVAPKYRDTATGKTWSGRGKEPSWIKGKNRDEFLIKD